MGLMENENSPSAADNWDANETEMDLFSAQTTDSQSSSLLFPVSKVTAASAVHWATTSVTDTINGVMSPEEWRQFQERKILLRKRWKIYTNELIRFRTLSRDPTYIGYHNDDYDEEAFERIPGPPNSANRPNSEIGK